MPTGVDASTICPDKEVEGASGSVRDWDGRVQTTIKLMCNVRRDIMRTWTLGNFAKKRDNAGRWV